MTTTTDATRDSDDGALSAQDAAAKVSDAPEGATKPAASQDDRDQPEPVRAARKEAASYRRKLRDAETEVARLAGIAEGYQRTAVEQLAEQGPRALASGADLWAVGTDLASLLDEQGRPDAAKVAEAVGTALTARPHWRRSYGSADNGARGTGPEATPSWSAVLSRR